MQVQGCDLLVVPDTFHVGCTAADRETVNTDEVSHRVSLLWPAETALTVPRFSRPIGLLLGACLRENLACRTHRRPHFAA